MIYILILFATTWLVHFLIREMRKPKNFPNGPLFYPIIGNMFTLSRLRKQTGSIAEAVETIAGKYSGTDDMVGVKIGNVRVVFTRSMTAFKEMCLNSDFDGRPFDLFYVTRTWNKRRGIIFTDQEFWQAQHRFLIRQLKDFGYARKGMSEVCENEMEFCVSDFRKLIEEGNGKSAIINMRNLLAPYILNTLWHFMTGMRYDVNNEELKHLQTMLSDLLRSCDMSGMTFSYLPFLRHIAPKATGFEDFVKFHENIYAFLSAEVQRHKKNFNPSDEPRDLIDAYLQILHAGDESGKAHKSFSEQQLLSTCLDMFVAGSETTNNTTDFLMLHLTRNPDVQEKARKEVDRVVGRNRLPKIADRPNLPYCEAISHEVMRVFMKKALGIPHRALKDTKLCGYDIPKDTTLIPLLKPNAFIPNAFKNPDTFDPENFLDDDGKVFLPENFFPFSLGKRRCMGEALARSNLFLICATIVQNYYLSIPEGHDVPTDEIIDSATPSVREYQAVITIRE